MAPGMLAMLAVCPPSCQEVISPVYSRNAPNLTGRPFAATNVQSSVPSSSSIGNMKLSSSDISISG